MELKEIKRAVNNELSRFERSLHNAVLSKRIPLELPHHLDRFKGKHLRPMLLILSARAVAPRLQLKDIHYNIAVILELIHNATLIHDDVLDEAKIRRNTATFNQRWGNEMAVLFGDYLFSQAFVGCSDVGSSDALKLLSGVAKQMCLGELNHMSNRFCFDFSESDYLKIIGEKTASLFAAATHLGALFSTGNTKIISALKRFGRNFGLAYQIMDDYLDITSDDIETGKSSGTDLYKGKMTMPIIRYLKTASKGGKNRLVRLITNGNGELSRRNKLYKLLDNEGAMAYTRIRLRHFILKADNALKPVPNSHYKDCLLYLLKEIANEAGVTL
ncbi:MAG: polyprenyl synthetase family protein [Planctomycetes bacterium]|nr:polyprenyl synthetase family protein [Planctomycetota bacterium]